MAGLNYNYNSTEKKTVANVNTQGSNYMLLGVVEQSGLAPEYFLKAEDIASKAALDSKQNALTAGTNISIDANNVISAVDTTYTSSNFEISQLADQGGLRTTWSNKQDAIKFSTPKTGNVTQESDGSLNVDLSSVDLWTTDTTSSPNRLKPKTTGLDVEANAFYASSDICLKDNIVPVTDEAIEKANNIPIVEFDWIANDRHSVGIIAQKVQEELPYLVSEGNVLTVNYIPLLLLKIASLEKRVKELESKTF